MLEEQPQEQETRNFADPAHMAWHAELVEDRRLSARHSPARSRSSTAPSKCRPWPGRARSARAGRTAARRGTSGSVAIAARSAYLSMSGRIFSSKNWSANCKFAARSSSKRATAPSEAGKSARQPDAIQPHLAQVRVIAAVVARHVRVARELRRRRGQLADHAEERVVFRAVVEDLADPPETVVPAVAPRNRQHRPVDNTTARPARCSSSAFCTPVWPDPTISTPPGGN